MKRAREFNILMDDVAITHLSFGTEVRSSQPGQPSPVSICVLCQKTAPEELVTNRQQNFIMAAVQFLQHLKKSPIADMV